jgi:hypothetical protein
MLIFQSQVIAFALCIITQTPDLSTLYLLPNLYEYLVNKMCISFSFCLHIVRKDMALG